MSEQESKILIDILEEQEIKLDDSREAKLAEISGKGTIKVLNTSQRSRLWNLKLDVGETLNTKLEKDHEKKALEAGSSWELDYEIADPKPILKYFETVDATKKTEHIDPFFVFGATDECVVTLLVKNLIDKDIQNVVVTKKLPKWLGLLETGEVTSGQATIDRESRTFKWELSLLRAGAEEKASFSGTTKIEKVKPRSAKEVTVTYEADGAILTSLSPTITALTDTMSGIETDEADEPGKWECELEFSNESEFQVTLSEAEVTTPIATGTETLVDLKPNAVLEPDKSWTHEFLVTSPDVPKLNSSFEFTANHSVHTKIVGKIEKPGTIYEVLRCEVEKDIKPPTVNAYANTDMTITNTISNVGSAPVSTVKVEDDIPPDFELPKVEDVAVQIGDVQITSSNMDVKVTENQILIDAHDLEGWLLPESKMVVTYPLVARNPRPEVKYPTPVKVTSNTKPWGTEYISGVSPEIGIRYVKRKIRAMKSVSPGQENEFIIKLKLRNKGDVELEHITVREVLPVGFKITSFRPKELVPVEEEVGDHSELVWKVDRIDPDDDLRVSYTVEGEGEYPRTEPEVTVGEGEDKGSAAKAPAPASAAPAVKQKNVGIISDLFDDTVRTIQQGVLLHEAAAAIEKLRDKLQETGGALPIIHEIGGYTRELQKQENKPAVGDRQAQILAKIAGWRNKMLG
ncbi:MAG: hypothetical protein ACTSU5_16060 [Promethearchaeota archaeon]